MPVEAIEFTAGGRRWRASTSTAFDLAIPLEFGGPQPAFFSETPATTEPLSTGDFVGDVGRGGSCNCGVYTLAPHCHGTHTECVGHLSHPVDAVARIVPAPALALLVSIAPVALSESGAAPRPISAPGDQVITRELLDRAARRWTAHPWTGLVVRTQPNDPEKASRAYAGASPAAYFTTDAMEWIVTRGVESLVVDLPSLDRADDGGQLESHRTFWGLPAGSTDPREARRRHALVTELAYVPDAVPDGLYLLNLQVPAFVADAAPSRPVLHPAAAVE